jgi:glycosyltransferase involved in cell wall biosynthesis
MKSLSVIIACYNEEKSVLSFEDVFLDKRFLDLMEQYKIEIIFVNDGSKDKTIDSINYLKNKYDFVKGVDLEKNSGKDLAIYYGFENAKYEYLCEIDSDRGYLLFEIDRFLKFAKENIIVHGIRKNRMFFNSFMSFMNNLLVCILFFKFKFVKDIVGQPNIITKNLYNNYLKNVLYKMHDHWCYPVLLHMQCLKHNISYKYIDVKLKPREFDESKGSEGFRNSIFLSIKMIKMYIKLKIKLRKYNKLENKEDL